MLRLTCSCSAQRDKETDRHDSEQQHSDDHRSTSDELPPATDPPSLMLPNFPFFSPLSVTDIVEQADEFDRVVGVVRRHPPQAQIVSGGGQQILPRAGLVPFPSRWLRGGYD